MSVENNPNINAAKMGVGIVRLFEECIRGQAKKLGWLKSYKAIELDDLITEFTTTVSTRLDGLVSPSPKCRGYRTGLVPWHCPIALSCARYWMTKEEWGICEERDLYLNPPYLAKDGECEYYRERGEGLPEYPEFDYGEAVEVASKIAVLGEDINE